MKFSLSKLLDATKRRHSIRVSIRLRVPNSIYRSICVLCNKHPVNARITWRDSVRDQGSDEHYRTRVTAISTSDSTSSVAVAHGQSNSSVAVAHGQSNSSFESTSVLKHRTTKIQVVGKSEVSPTAPPSNMPSRRATPSNMPSRRASLRLIISNEEGQSRTLSPLQCALSPLPATLSSPTLSSLPATLSRKYYKVTASCVQINCIVCALVRPELLRGAHRNTFQPGYSRTFD